MKKTAYLAALVLLFLGQLCPAAILSHDIVKIKGLPPIGKWMLAANLKPANWLGQKYHGIELREPINVIIIDRRSASTAEAVRRLGQACRQAGYASRWGHSGGYHGYLAGALYPQLPAENYHAFSNAPFIMNNSHGRVFGPYYDGEHYFFSAAFSRERIVPAFDRKKMHQYRSFIIARDDFVARMDKKTGYKAVKYVDLKNSLINDPVLTTGDHDGRAAVLVN